MTRGKPPVFKRVGGRVAGHASDDALLAYADDEDGLTPTQRGHIAACVECASRAVELRRMRRLLQATAAHAQTPPRDIARKALNRVRHRRAAIGGVNEWFGVVAALLRGFSTLLARDPVTNDAAADARTKMTTRG